MMQAEVVSFGTVRQIGRPKSFGSTRRVVLLSILLGTALSLFPRIAAAQAQDVYVTQTGADPGSGVCAGQTIISLAKLNSSGTWGTGASQIGPGTTVHMCGVFTAAMNVQGSGAAGNPITILFDTGAKFSGPKADFNGSGGIIALGSHSYLIFDGGTANQGGPGVQGGKNSNMELTDTGTALTQQASINGFYSTGAHDVEVRNFGCYNLYVHLYNSTYTNDTTEGTDGHGCFYANPWGVNLSIHDSTFADSDDGIMLFSPNSPNSNLQVYRMTMYHIDHFMFYSGPTCCTFVHDNHFSTPANWDTSSNKYHHDGHIIPMSSGQTMDQIYIYNNLYDGDWGGHTTSPVFYDIEAGSYLTNLYVFNEVYKGSDMSNPWANGLNTIPCYTAGACTNAGPLHIWNNTVICPNNGGGAAFQVTGQGVDFRNNLETSCAGFINNSGGASFGNSVSAFDYNVYGSPLTGSGNGPWQFDGVTSSGSSLSSQFASWRGIIGGMVPGAEVHSQAVASAGVDSLGVLQAGSPAIGKGVNLCTIVSCTGPLSALAYDTSAGNTRIPTARQGSWDVGAYSFNNGSSGNQPVQPPTGLTATVN